MSRHLEI